MKPPKQKRISLTEERFNILISNTTSQSYSRGVRDTEQLYKTEKEQSKKAQVEAVTKLIEETGRIMSRAGYMLGKLNGDTSR